MTIWRQGSTMKESFVKFYRYGLHTLKYTWTIHSERQYFIEDKKKIWLVEYQAAVNGKFLFWSYYWTKKLEEEYQFFHYFKKEEKKKRKNGNLLQNGFIEPKFAFFKNVLCLHSFCLKYYNIIYKNYTNSLKWVLSNQLKGIYEQKQKGIFFTSPNASNWLIPLDWMSIKDPPFSRKYINVLLSFITSGILFDIENLNVWSFNAGKVDKNPNLELLYVFANQNHLD